MITKCSIMAIAFIAATVLAADQQKHGAPASKPQETKGKTNFIHSDITSEHPDQNDTQKVLFDGGMYSQKKYDNVELNLNAKPQMRLISPMERHPPVKKYADDDDTKYPPYSLSDINHSVAPCGNTQKGRVHFDAEIESVALIEWEVKEEAAKGMCIMKLADAPDDQDYDILWPLDDSAETKGRHRGYFPCGTAKTPVDSKLVKFPANITCDSCILQFIWSAGSHGKFYYCADIEILGGKIEDCSGQCMNGGMCLNGACQCRKGFQGSFCQIHEYVPDSTNYSKYLKYFLFFIIMILAIILLIFGAYMLFKYSENILANLRRQQQVAVDEDDLGGQSNAQLHQASKFGQNMNMTEL